MKRVPTLLRIIQVDYTALLGALMPVAIWGLWLAMLLLEPDEAAIFRSLAVPVTVVGLGLLFWRSRFIMQTYEDGSQAEGVVSNVHLFRGRGRIYYTYFMVSEKYLTSNAINSSARTRTVRPGQPVSVTYNRHQPKRAFIDELYL